MLIGFCNTALRKNFYLRLGIDFVGNHATQSFASDANTYDSTVNFLITDQEIDEESFHDLDDKEIDKLITKAGPRIKFKRQFKLFKVMFCSVKTIYTDTDQFL